MKSTIKKILKPFNFIYVAFGFNPRKIFTLRYYFAYLRQRKQFRKMGGLITHTYPILTDYSEQAGSASGHYFHQDLLVASLVYEKNPSRHIDIGSRVDGFVAHVASFRKIEVIDIRDLKDTGHKNISFIQADLMDAFSVKDEITDSISCLHAIEHFGLGRYGDPIDPKGYLKGFNNIVRMLKPGGYLYISFPISNQNEVQFNAQRVFHPKDIFNWTDRPNCLALERFDYVDQYGSLHQQFKIEADDLDVPSGCGIYQFKKLN